jgi:hypothetical protein
MPNPLNSLSWKGMKTLGIFGKSLNIPNVDMVFICEIIITFGSQAILSRNIGI